MKIQENPYGGISMKLIKKLDNTDIRHLRKMIKILKAQERLNLLKPNTFKNFQDLKDWIDEYKQEGHIL